MHHWRRIFRCLPSGHCLGAMLCFINVLRNEERRLAAVAACEEASSTCSPMSSYLNVFCPEFPDVADTDPAPRFIAENALNDLAHFTFDRDTKFLDKPGEVGRKAFDVVDLDRQRHVVLDTSIVWNGSTASLSSKPDGPLQSLSMQVFGFRTTICIVLEQANGTNNLENCAEISS